MVVEIARRTNLDKGTISRYRRGLRRLAPATEARVRTAMHQIEQEAAERRAAERIGARLLSAGLAYEMVTAVSDEELDRMLIKGMQEKDPGQLCSLPSHRLNSAASEIRNWVATAGAVEHLNLDYLEYVAVNRSPAGTGGGWCFAQWT